jgi:putative transposase
LAERQPRSGGGPSPSGAAVGAKTAVYTTNAIESLNFSLRRITKARGSFLSDEAAIKLLYLGLRSITKRWTMPAHDWKAALNQFSMLFEDRMLV